MSIRPNATGGPRTRSSAMAIRATIAIFRVTVRQLLGRKLNWFLLAIAVLPAGVFVLVQSNMTDDRAVEFFQEVLLSVLVLFVVPITSVLHGTAALGDERQHSTLSFIVLRPIPRGFIVTAKIAAAWSVALLIAGTGSLVASVLLGVLVGNWETLFPMLLLVALTTTGYVALMVPLGHVMLHAAFAGFVYALIWDFSLGNIPGLAPFTLARTGLSAYVALVPESLQLFEEDLGSVTPGAWGAVLKVLVLLLISGFVTTQLFRRRDLA